MHSKERKNKMMIRRGTTTGKIVDKTEDEKEPKRLGDIPRSVADLLNDDEDTKNQFGNSHKEK